MNPDSPGFEAMREEFFVNYERCMTERTYVFEGVKDMLSQLETRGVLCGVVTNKSNGSPSPWPLKCHCSRMPRLSSAEIQRPMRSRILSPCWKPHAASALTRPQCVLCRRR